MTKKLWDWVLLQCKQITPAASIAAELLELEMQLLKAETLREFAESQVSYNKNRVKRLKAYTTVPAVDEKAT